MQHDILFFAGVISFTNNPASPLPQTNCSLTTDIEDKADFPLNLLLLITGLVLVFVDIGITALLCMIKWRRCGVLSIAWYLVTVVCAATWTFISVFYLAVVTPTWVGSKETCDYLVMLVTLVAVSYCGILTLAYVVVIVVVISYDCNRWRNLRDL